MKTNRHMLRFGVAGMLLWCVMLVHATCLSGLQPFFPGGENAFREYVNANFRVNKRDMSEGIGCAWFFEVQVGYWAERRHCPYEYHAFVTSEAGPGNAPRAETVASVAL